MHCPQPEIQWDEEHPVARGTIAVHLLLIMRSLCWSVSCMPFSCRTLHAWNLLLVLLVSVWDRGSHSSRQLQKHLKTPALYWAPPSARPGGLQPERDLSKSVLTLYLGLWPWMCSVLRPTQILGMIPSEKTQQSRTWKQILATERLAVRFWTNIIPLTVRWAIWLPADCISVKQIGVIVRQSNTW